MTKLTATFRIVTPMFLGGADPAREAELRVPSIKGALRFWWRALMWGKVKDIADLHRREAELFGSSDEGQSRFLMRLEAAVTEANVVQENWPQAQWQRYTGYGLRDKGERCFLKPGREFTVHFHLRRCSDEQSAQLLAAVQLFGLLGGLGARSRKGWGSVTLSKLDGAAWQCPAMPEQWKQTVQSIVPQPPSRSAAYSAFTQAARWNSGATKPNSAAAQQWLGQLYQGHVKSTDPKAHRAQFGLPREFKKGTLPRRERRASPLFLHIHQCPDGKALPCALWLPADFLQNTSPIPGNGDSARQFVESLNDTIASSAR